MSREKLNKLWDRTVIYFLTVFWYVYDKAVILLEIYAFSMIILSAVGVAYYFYADMLSKASLCILSMLAFIILNGELIEVERARQQKEINATKRRSY